MPDFHSIRKWELIEFIVLSQVHLDDDLPQELCRVCLQRLDQAVAFKKQIESIDALLHNKQNTKWVVSRVTSSIFCQFTTFNAFVGNRYWIKMRLFLSTTLTSESEAILTMHRIGAPKLRMKESKNLAKNSKRKVCKMQSNADQYIQKYVFKLSYLQRKNRFSRQGLRRED